MHINTDKPYRLFADTIESEALQQFESAMQQPFVVRGALMADAHVGYSLPIGAVIATDSVVVPAWVGYDIGCGMCAVPLSQNKAELSSQAEAIFTGIYQQVPVGFSHNSQPTDWAALGKLDKTAALAEIFGKNGLFQLGSLGGGNHFIEIGADEQNQGWIVIHSGSRGIGHAVATHYMKLASGTGKAREGHYGLKVNSKDGQDYLKDLNFCLAFALENRMEIMRRVVKTICDILPGRADWDRLINRTHNHVEQKGGTWIHRKGATHAESGMMGVIPGNMRDGSFIVRGKGNPDSLCSSSHGAGRVLGRKNAKATIKLADFSATMRGITARVNQATLDESPFAYKNIFTIIAQQRELIDVVAHVTPIVNIKG